MESKPLKTFIIYARADDQYKHQLLMHLQPLVSSRLLDVWHDGKIEPGENWEQALQEELNSSDLVLLLVSVHSLNSEFIQSRELRTALQRLEARLTRVLPIVVSPCAWKFDPVIARFQLLPPAGQAGFQPVSEWPNPALAWTKVTEQIGDMVLGLRNEQNDVIRHWKENSTYEGDWTYALEVRKNWDVTQKIPTVVGLRQFLAEFPNSPYTAEAERQIKSLRLRRYGVFTGLCLAIISLILLYQKYFPDPPEPPVFHYDMVKIEGGQFTMGDAAGKPDECPHPETVESFHLGAFEVTQKQWRTIMGTIPTAIRTPCDSCPVVNVSWYDVKLFIDTLNKLLNTTKYRLPTEKEWEYAAKGRNRLPAYQFAGSTRLDSVAWYRDNSSSRLHIVGRKPHNGIGLYDMCGNVWEWCEDVYRPYQNCAPAFVSNRSKRVIRGGSWYNTAEDCRVSVRAKKDPGEHDFNIGFRLAHH